MKKKFRVGNKVKIIKNSTPGYLWTFSMYDFIGKIGIVEGISDNKTLYVKGLDSLELPWEFNFNDVKKIIPYKRIIKGLLNESKNN